MVKMCLLPFFLKELVLVVVLSSQIHIQNRMDLREVTRLS